MALEAEPIELVESAGDEIVDLTCESLEPVVVDLTHNDSVVIVEERRRPRRNARRLRQDHADSCVVSSDDEELSRDRDVYVTTQTPEMPGKRQLQDSGPLAPSVVRSAWTGTQRLCRTDVSSFPQNAAMSSVASASAIPLRTLTLAQLAGKRSTTNDTTPFIYEVSRAAQESRMDRQSLAGFATWPYVGSLPPVS